MDQLTELWPELKPKASVCDLDLDTFSVSWKSTIHINRLLLEKIYKSDAQICISFYSEITNLYRKLQKSFFYVVYLQKGNHSTKQKLLLDISAIIRSFLLKQEDKLLILTHTLIISH